jgi:hypothetical protein
MEKPGQWVGAKSVGVPRRPFIQAEPLALGNERAPSFEGISVYDQTQCSSGPGESGTNHRGLCTKLPPEGGRGDNLGTQ